MEGSRLAATSWMLLVLAGCASASETDARTWPAWERAEPVANVVVEPAAAGPVHTLPEGTPGLRPTEARTRTVPAPSSEDPPLPLAGSVFHFLAHVYEAPRPGARAIGYMRRGTRFRAGPVAGHDGCADGWHPVWGGGYVCRGQGYRVDQVGERDPAHPAPNLSDPLPYRYVKVVARTAQTWRLPSPDDDPKLRALEASWAAPVPDSDPSAQVPDAGAPDKAKGGGASTVDAGVEGGAADAESGQLPTWVRMIDEPGHYLSVADEVTREDGRVFLQTVRGAFVRRDATLEVEATGLQGHVLSEGLQLPVALAHRQAERLALNPDGTTRTLPELARGDVLGLTGGERQHRGRRYLEVTDGTLVDARRVKRVVARSRPALVPRGARWVHVDVGAQTLTAYEGERPVYVTLVSSGKPGFDTPQGLHRVHAKHVTATMDDTALSEGAYYIEDVPWTMYFQGSYALHAAFWHDRFGHSRSHGCVNLAPRDARWLFGFLTPHLPGGRHGVLVPGERPSYVLVDAGESAESS